MLTVRIETNKRCRYYSQFVSVLACCQRFIFLMSTIRIFNYYLFIWLVLTIWYAILILLYHLYLKELNNFWQLKLRHLEGTIAQKSAYWRNDTALRISPSPSQLFLTQVSFFTKLFSGRIFYLLGWFILGYSLENKQYNLLTQLLMCFPPSRFFLFALPVFSTHFPLLNAVLSYNKVI